MSCLTEWALPNKRSLHRTDTNFDYRAAPPEDKSASISAGGQIIRYVAPFNLAFNTQLGYFPWLELPENEDRFVRFGHAMTGTRQWEIKNQILQGAIYSYDEAYGVLLNSLLVIRRILLGKPASRFSAR